MHVRVSGFGTPNANDVDMLRAAIVFVVLACQRAPEPLTRYADHEHRGDGDRHRRTRGGARAVVLRIVSSRQKVAGATHARLNGGVLDYFVGVR